MPRTLLLLALTLIFGGVLVLASHPALALDGCKVGQRVKKPGGKLATVTVVAGSGCTVRADGEPFTDTYAAFMLDPAPGSAPDMPKSQAAKAPAATGFYQCTSGAAGNLTLRILAGGRYANAQGVTGNYTRDASGRMAFKGGPWDGYYGATLAGGRIGLTASPTGTFYQMTCDRRGN